MTVPFVSALPPRMPSTESDMATMLASWMDSEEGEVSISLSSSDCQRDLQTIGNLRKTIGESTVSKDMAEDLHEYYHYLVECESHGMTLQNIPANNPLCVVWKSSINPSSVQTVTSLEGERANLLWNIAAMEAHRASLENRTTQPGWRKASMRLQKAANCIGHLLAYMETHNLPSTTPETSPDFLVLWKALLLAQAQHCLYESVSIPRPIHGLLVKFAAALVPLYTEVTRIASQQMLQMELYNDLADFARAWGAYMSCQTEYHQSQIHKAKKDWGLEIARLDLAYQYAAVCKNLCDNTDANDATILDELKKAVDEKLQLLQNRLEIAQKENEDTHKQAIPDPQELAEIRGQNLVKSNKPLSDILSPKKTEPLFQKQREEPMIPLAAVTIPGSITTTGTASKRQPGNFPNDPYNDNNDDDENDAIPPPMTKIGPPQLSASSSSSSFYQKKMAPRSSVASSQLLRTYVEVFNVEMSEIIEDLARASEDQSESARLALNEVHLPHSLRAYQQEQSGGGLPDDLWERVHQLQQDNSVIQLKQDLWELKDAADLAKSIHGAISSQLDYDTNTDKAFREEKPDFSGHDAWDAQKSFRKVLAKYEKLLSSAKDGDEDLFQRLEQLDIEPKYDLLQFSKAQLDLLLPGAMNDPDLVVDTQQLSLHCGELRTLFQKKADLISMMRNELETFDVARAIEDTVASRSRSRRTDEDYLEATKHAQKHFEGLRLDIQSCMEHQNELLGTILVENEAFMNSRQRTMNSQSAESCIVMIEDAMDEIDQLSKHLKEGKDFYNVVLPKLDELKQQVDDVSARLTVERLEYYETEKKASQEQKDAEMAQQLNEEAASTAEPAAAATAAQSTPPATQEPPNGEDVEDTKPAATPSPLPVPSSVAARAPHSNVDDEKVATLVAMEFDADMVVEALEKHNNNMDMALNELLSC